MPSRAIDAVAEALGDDASALPRSAMLPVAVRGAVEAAATYDLERGVTYAQWALYYAIYALLNRLRKDHGQDKPMLARIRKAMCAFLAHEKRALDPWTVTRESATRGLACFADGVGMSGLLEWGSASALAARGEDGVVELEAATNAGDALRKVVGGLRPEQRHLVEQCHAYGAHVKHVARASGRSYHAVLREYHDLLELMGTRLRGLGIEEMPPWRADVSGQVLDGPAANDGDDG